jgi:hypothetical protein
MPFGFQEFPECQATKLQLIQDVESINAASPFVSDSIVNGCHIQENIGNVRVVKVFISMVLECPRVIPESGDGFASPDLTRGAVSNVSVVLILQESPVGCQSTAK